MSRAGYGIEDEETRERIAAGALEALSYITKKSDE
jgi:hypothetical protein